MLPSCAGSPTLRSWSTNSVAAHYMQILKRWEGHLCGTVPIQQVHRRKPPCAAAARRCHSRNV